MFFDGNKEMDVNGNDNNDDEVYFLYFFCGKFNRKWDSKRFITLDLKIEKKTVIFRFNFIREKFVKL